jgi:hypothetical protein
MKKYLKIFSSVSQRTYVLLFVAVILLSSVYTFFQIEDGAALDKKIATRQKELERAVVLKDLYLAKKKSVEAQPKKTEEKSLSLGLIENITGKAFTAGRLTSLRPATVKEERGRSEAMFEVKVSGAALGEVIAFVKEVENSGLHLRKLQLNLAASGTLVDMYATITAG